MHRNITLSLILAATVVLPGCATYYSVPLRSTGGPGVPAQAAQPTGLSIGELLQMLQAHRPQNEIINDVRARGLRVAPAPADLDVLAGAGAIPELIQAVQGAASYQQAQVANGGVPPAVVQEQVTVYQETYPWVPFGLGLGIGLGYYGGYWGYPYYRPYAPVVRPFGWAHAVGPRVVVPGGYRGGGYRGGYGGRGRR